MRAWVALVAGALALAGCEGKPKEVTADGGWVRLAAVKGRPAAAYFTIHGGPVDRTLISVSCDVAIRSEMHETMRAGSVADMKPLGSVAVPARTDVAFRPGGRHVMLFDVNPGIRPGGPHPPRLTLTFADGTRIELAASVVNAGDPAPGA